MKVSPSSLQVEEMPRTRRTLLLTGLCAAVLAFAGCLAPTLPLPPPARPEVSPPDSSGIATVRGRVPGGTTAMVENLANGEVTGKVTDDTGLYTVKIPAEVDDRLSVYYVDSLTRSQTTIVLVPEPEESSDNLGGAGGQAP